MAEQDVAPTPTDQPAAAGGASATAHIGAIVLGLGLLMGAVSNQPVSLSNQLLPRCPRQASSPPGCSWAWSARACSSGACGASDSGRP